MEALRWIADETLLYGLLEGLPATLLLIIISISIILLWKGADWMIEGVVSFAERTGLPKIVIGATIISLGTTTPEAFVSVMAAWMGNPGLALGNGVGSIIADTALILGLTCILSKVPVDRYILNRTGIVQVGVATLLVAISVIAWGTMSGQPVLNRWVGGLFLFLLAVYMYLTFFWSKKRRVLETVHKLPDHTEPANTVKSFFMITGGLFLVVAGARILVPSSVEIASRIGVPEDIIAATMIALGTSLPEMATAIAAVRKGHPEITVGNIVGADVLNCLFVIGASAVTRPLVISSNFFTFHFPAMLIVLYSFRAFIVINKDGWFKKWQGAWLLGIYFSYLILQYATNIGAIGR
ncbi:MAG: calcium/sodium antiporter [Thermodesulfobacteriota bacterium]|nr:calcium/sodium antiporter [Thermodesulfobacteriota bacterium]